MIIAIERWRYIRTVFVNKKKKNVEILGPNWNKISMTNIAIAGESVAVGQDCPGQWRNCGGWGLMRTINPPKKFLRGAKASYCPPPQKKVWQWYESPNFLK